MLSNSKKKRKNKFSHLQRLNSPFKMLFPLFLFGIVCQSNLSAQTNIFPSSGKTGIGTTTPSSQLEVVAPAIVGGESLQKWRVSDAANDYLDIANGTSGSSLFLPMLRGQTVSSNNSALTLIGQIDSGNDNGNNPVMSFDVRYAGSKVNNRSLFSWSSYTTTYMTMLANGNLGVGTSTPDEKLSVNGKIRAHEIKVESTNWPDYVFLGDYQLPSLKQIEQYIKLNGHLPEIPSASEVESNGINLGEVNAKLLKKIEELTLHLIEKEKDQKKQQKEIDQLKEQVAEILAKQK